MNCQLVYLHVLACSGAYSNCKYMQIINSGIFLATYFWIKISGKRHLFLRDAKDLLRDSIYNTPPSQGYQTASENVSFGGMPESY